MSLSQRIAHFFKTTPKRYTIGGAAIIVILIGGLFILHIVNRVAPAAAVTANNSHVTLASVASLSSDTSALPTTGTVSSLHQATILAESSGQITAVYASLGDTVSAGEELAKLDNASQAAAVVQAQGAYAAAQAALAQASGTTAQNSTATANQATQNVTNAQASAAATLQSTFTALDDAVHTRADEYFINPKGSNPTLVGFTVPDSQLVVTLQNERPGLEATLADAQSIATDPSTDIDASIAKMSDDVQTVQTFLNNMVAMINQAVPNQSENAAAISAAQTSLSAARSEVVATIAALTSAKNGYDAAVASVATATNTATGGTQNSIAGAQANVEEALGSLDAAQANLEKTVIRSPISGTIVNLPIKLGDYLNTGGTAAIVSNAAALQIVTHVTAEDAKSLAVGGKASIEGTAAGVITSIAPALDPTTNEIEVDIGITSGAATLTDGQSVTVNLTRSNTESTAASTGSDSSAASSTITIPIVALKITPTGPIVFTVNASSTLVAVPVTLGSILGDEVQIESGLTEDMVIVQDARGHVAGDVVTVDAQ
jgi:RND family efflux transporter MFP subunit